MLISQKHIKKEATKKIYVERRPIQISYTGAIAPLAPPLATPLYERTLIQHVREAGSLLWD